MADALEPGPSLEPGAIRKGDFRSEPEPSGTSLKGSDVKETADTDLDSDSRKLIDDFNASPNVERAKALAEMLARPDFVLKELTLDYPYGVVLKEESRNCRLMVIEALSRSTKLVRLTIWKATEGEVLGLCKSLAANQSVKCLSLRDLYGIREKEAAAAAVGSMLAENSTLEELVLDIRYSGDRDIEQMIRPLIGSEDGEPPRNTSLHTLTILGFVLISAEGASAVARMLRTNKSLLSLHLPRCTHIEEMIRPLIGSDDGEPPLNTSLRTLTMEGHGLIFLEGASAVARMLRTNKSLLSLRLPGYYLDSSEMDMIVKSLENNRTLQEVQLWWFYDHDVELMVRLLVEHNFTLKTIWYQGGPYSAEDFIQKVLEEQGPFLKRRLPSNMVTHYHVQPTAESISSSMASHDIYLSYSEDGRDFAKQLYTKLRASNYNVLNDPDSSNKYKEELSTISKCKLVIIVFSEVYVTSKHSMLELSRFMKMKNTSDQPLKVIPLFYKLRLSDLNTKYMELKWVQSRREMIEDGKDQEEEIGLWNETVKVIFDEKNTELEGGKALLEDLIQGTINVEDFCTQFNGACDVLEFMNYGNSEKEYLLAVVEEIKNIIPPIRKNESDQVLEYFSIFEMESEQSLQRLSSMLKEEPLLASKFLLQRALNKGEYLRDKYMGGNTFEEMDEEDERYGKGCNIVALFPKAFLYHFKAQLLCGALNKASNFDDKCCEEMLIATTNEVRKKWRILCGYDDQLVYVRIGEEIAKLENIFEVSMKDVDGEGTYILCCYNEYNSEFEFYFQHHKEMTSIVGVGLEYAKAILINGREVKVKEILEEEWVKAWRQHESNTNPMKKVLKLNSSMLDQEEKMISNEKVSPKLLIWELAKYFTLKKCIEKLSIATTSEKYVTTSGDSISKSQSSSGGDGNQSDFVGSFTKWFAHLGLTNNRSKNQDHDNNDNNEDKEDKEDDKNDKLLKNQGSSDENDKDTTVVVELLCGGNIKDRHTYDHYTQGPKLKTLAETIVPTIEFTFINRENNKKIRIIVGNIYFNLGIEYVQVGGEHGTSVPVQWIHTDMKIEIGLHGEEAESKGEFLRDSIKHLDVKEGTQSTKLQKTIEKREGKEIGGSVGASATFHGVGLTARADGKVTNSDGNIQQIERAYERRCYSIGDNLSFNGRLSRTEKGIMCDYGFEQPRDSYHDLSKSPMGISQAVRFQGTMLPYDVGRNGADDSFVPYKLIASRHLEEIVSTEANSTDVHKGKGKKTQKEVPREGIKCEQEYWRMLYISHAMTHINGKFYDLKERWRAADSSRYLSERATPGIPYVWQNGTLVKLELQTSSMDADSHVATTNSLASTSQA